MRLIRSIYSALGELLRRDDGAAYSFSLAATLPFFGFVVLLLIELAIMLNVQTGVDYASIAAARAAMVWIPAETTATSSAAANADMVRRAAVNALSPWGSSAIAPPSRPILDKAGAAAVCSVYRGTAPKLPQSDDWVSRKWTYANTVTRVTFNPPLPVLLQRRNSGREKVTVEVRYLMPFQFHVTGIILGSRNGSHWYRELVAKTEVVLERPLSVNGSIGVGYSSLPAKLP